MLFASMHVDDAFICMSTLLFTNRVNFDAWVEGRDGRRVQLNRLPTESTGEGGVCGCGDMLCNVYYINGYYCNIPTLFTHTCGRQGGSAYARVVRTQHRHAHSRGIIHVVIKQILLQYSL